MADLGGICWTHSITDIGNGWYRGVINFGGWRSFQFTSKSKAEIEAWMKQKQTQEMKREVRRHG